MTEKHTSPPDQETENWHQGGKEGTSAETGEGSQHQQHTGEGPGISTALHSCKSPKGTEEG